MKLFVKPAVEGNTVRIPEREMKPMEPTGEWVINNMYWQARLLNRDVVRVDPPAEISDAPVA
jgi:Protein of unknown function (DUF2635)